MNTLWVLILLIDIGMRSSTATVQEFSTEDRCRAVQEAVAIHARKHAWNVYANCVPK